LSRPATPKSFAVESNTLRTAFGVRVGRNSNIKATMPLTCAAATEVPVDNW
jgi:hypothetical protein